MKTGKVRASAGVKGYSLVELMVALTIGLIILGAVASLFVTSKASYSTQVGIDALQENGRYAIRALADDVRLAGYVGITYDPIKVSPQVYAVSVGSACAANWVDIGQPIYGINANSPTHNPNPYTSTCIPAADYRVGTDILVLRHASNQVASSLSNNTIYLSVELECGRFFTGTSLPAGSCKDASLSVSNPNTIHEMNIHVYYIRPYATVPGDGIPTLVRETLIAGPAMVAQPLVEGVENMQVSYGVDTTVPGDNVVDAYVSASGVSNWAQVVSVRIELLIRAPSREGGVTNSTSYTLGDITIPAANDQFRRGVYSTTIQLRNHRKT